jgi:predicted PurR-regulated permease PerM
MPNFRDDARQPHNARHLVLFAFGIAVVVALFWFLRHAALTIYVSAVFAVVLKPAVDWLHRKSVFGWRPSRAGALLVIVLVLCLVLGVIIAVAAPSIASNADDFSDTLRRAVTDFERRLHSVPLLGKVSLSGMNSHFAEAIKAAVAAAAGATADIVTALLLIAYFILDGAAILTRITGVLPPTSCRKLNSTLERAAVRMRHWLAGQGLLMLILGGSATVTFGLMGLPYFYLLGLFAGLANIVPLLGPLATVILAGAVAATKSGWDVIGVLIFYMVYQQVENAFLTPNIMKSQVQLASAVVIVALLIGSELAGIAGALVAVPSAVLIAELANTYLPPSPENEETPVV